MPREKKVKEKKPNDLFGTINSVCSKTLITYDKKEASAYMLLLWLSHDKDLMFWVNTMNSVLFSVPDKLVYNYFFKKLPKKNRYIKWIAKEKNEKRDKEIIALCEKYGISKKEAANSL
jgi:hypothetical protein